MTLAAATGLLTASRFLSLSGWLASDCAIAAIARAATFVVAFFG